MRLSQPEFVCPVRKRLLPGKIKYGVFCMVPWSGFIVVCYLIDLVEVHNIEYLKDLVLNRAKKCPDINARVLL
jgi:hypothetical protein